MISFLKKWAVWLLVGFALVYLWLKGRKPAPAIDTSNLFQTPTAPDGLNLLGGGGHLRLDYVEAMKSQHGIM